MKVMKLKRLRNLLLCMGIAFGSILLPVVLTSCSNQTNTNDSSTSNDSNSGGSVKSSNELEQITNMTLSLNFVFDATTNGQKATYIQSGTGWVYDIDKENNNFYIATNLHVANILSFENKTITSVESTNTGVAEEKTKYGSIVSSYLRFVPLSLSSKSTTYYDNSVLENVYVDKPTIVYTTTTDETYNSVFNDKVYGLASYSYFVQEPTVKQYQAITDIAILKYHLPVESDYYLKHSSNIVQTAIMTTNSVKDFIKWIYWNRNEKTVTVYTGYIDSIVDSSDNKNRKFYMGGFPAHDQSGGENISWLGFSEFTINWAINSYFQYPWTQYASSSNVNSLSTPIAFYNSSSNENDSTSHNFISAGRQGLFTADSYHGASGSPILSYVDGKLQIVGIYWGSITASVNGTSVTSGVGDFFNSKGGGKSFNLTDSISKAIQNDEETSNASS